MSGAILPGATLGVLGSGQLGRMFAIAARRLGYRVHVLSPDYDTPTGQIADQETTAAYDDLDQVAEFARNVSVVTFEFENVPAATTEVAARYCPVRPGGNVLLMTQNRIREKTFLRDSGLPVTPFAPIDSPAALVASLAQLGCPAVLKTDAWGYDGKGQMLVHSASEAESAWNALGQQRAILEQLVDFECEMSVVGARGLDGQFLCYGPIANSHCDHILDLSVCPAGLSERIARDAVEITRTVFERLDVVGVLCVEFFATRTGQLLVNELAPRPHNSGHLTVDAHVSCQFEQQVRAVCGLPLGSARQLAPAAMVNLLGDIWSAGTPDWSAALAHPEMKLHLYGKRAPRAKRKMGHLTVLADTAAEATAQALAARAALLANASASLAGGRE